MPTTSTTKTKRRTTRTSTSTTTTRKGFLSPLSLEAFCAPYRLLAWTCKPTRRHRHNASLLVCEIQKKKHTNQKRNEQCRGSIWKMLIFFVEEKSIVFLSFLWLSRMATFLIQFEMEVQWRCFYCCCCGSTSLLHWYIAALKMRISWTGKKRKIAFDDTSRFRKPFCPFYQLSAAYTRSIMQ